MSDSVTPTPAPSDDVQVKLLPPDSLKEIGTRLMNGGALKDDEPIRLIATASILAQQVHAAQSVVSDLSLFLKALCMRQGGSVSIRVAELARLKGSKLNVQGDGKDVVLHAEMPPPTIAIAHAIPAGVNRLLKHGRNGKE